MYSCWQLRLHTSFRSSSHIDLFVPGDHSVSCVVSDSELLGFRRRIRTTNSVLIAKATMDRQKKRVLEEFAWLETISTWRLE